MCMLTLNMSQIVVETLKVYLMGMREQPAESGHHIASESCQDQARFGLIKRQRDNDMDLHSDQQVSYTLALEAHLNQLKCKIEKTILYQVITVK